MDFRATLLHLTGRLGRALTMRRYTPYTIAEYHRRMGAKVGEGCYIVPTQLGTEPYLVSIGNHVAIAEGVSFMTHDGAAWLFRDVEPDAQGFGPIIIHDNCFIGQRAMLGPNIRVGPNSIVAAGSLVITDVPPDTIVMGVPARPFGSVVKYGEKCLNQWSAQKPHGVRLDDGETWWTSRHYESNRRLLRGHLLEMFQTELR